MLLAELGENPLYQWIHSESPDFMRAMRVVDDAHQPQMNYRCPCGLNVSVHSAECVAGALIVAEPAWEIRKTDPSLVDQWVLCCRQAPPPEHEWAKMFGTMLQYPKNGTWAPVQTETHTMAMPKGNLPGENFCMALIRARQRTREIPVSKLDSEYTAAEEKKDTTRRQNIRHRIKDALPVNPNPGKRGGSISWGGIGDNRVTV